MVNGALSQQVPLAPPPGLEQFASAQVSADAVDSADPWIVHTNSHDNCWGEAWRTLMPDDVMKVPLNNLETLAGGQLCSDSELCDGMPGGKSAYAGWEELGGPQMGQQEPTGVTADVERETYTCRWHKSAQSVGSVSEDGHVFSKVAGGQKVIMGNKGVSVAVSSICMVYDESLRCGGIHEYNYQILNGQVGAADGAGFVFDSKVRRNNIQRMRSVFLNQKGCICLRNCERVEKLGQCLPPLEVGMSLIVQVDLDNMYLRFCVLNYTGHLVGMSDVSFEGLVGGNQGAFKSNSGFFCAVVTKDISVALN